MELNRLFRSLELKTGNPDDKIEGYLTAIAGVTYHALQTTVVRIIRGEIDGISRKFCPTPPELSAAIRAEMEAVQRQVNLAAERLALSDQRPTAAPRRTFQDRAALSDAEMRGEGRAVIATFPTFDAFLSARSQHREALQNGARYVALTGKLWGAPGAPGLNDEPGELTADVEW